MRRTHQTQEAESGCWKQTLRKSTILDEIGEEKKKSGVLYFWLFQMDFFFRRLEQLYYWEKPQEVIRHHCTSRPTWSWQLGLAHPAAGVTADPVWREIAEWFRVSQLPGESSSVLPVWVFLWVGIWVYLCLSLVTMGADVKTLRMGEGGLQKAFCSHSAAPTAASSLLQWLMA